MEMNAVMRILLLSLFAAPLVSCFSNNLVTPRPTKAAQLRPTRPSTHIFATSDDDSNKRKGPFDEGLRNKLVSESIAPWRTLRLFLYFSLGSGALIGGLITVSATLAALSSGRDDFDINTEYLNLAIDFGAVAIFAFLAKLDIDKGGELSEKVEEKIQRKKEQKVVAKGMKEREKQLGNLNLDIQVSADGDTKEAGVRQLQAGAKQHMIVVVGPRKAIKEALIGANLLKMDFAMSNVLVVPYELGKDPEARPEGGFAERPMYETQPYVARTTGEGWDEYIQAELKDAVEQNGEKVKKEGIAIVVARNGEIIRRGVGTVPWRQMVEQLQESGEEEKKDGLFPF